jgi:hypothetical protein
LRKPKLYQNCNAEEEEEEEEDDDDDERVRLQQVSESQTCTDFPKI